MCVIILTLYEERSFLKQALAAGVKGYVLKRSRRRKIWCPPYGPAVRRDLFDSLLGDEVREGGSPPADKVPQAAADLGLTDREASVLKYSARGLTTKEIAGRLEVSAKTVET